MLDSQPLYPMQTDRPAKAFPTKRNSTARARLNDERRSVDVNHVMNGQTDRQAVERIGLTVTERYRGTNKVRVEQLHLLTSTDCWIGKISGVLGGYTLTNRQTDKHIDRLAINRL